MRHYDDFEDFVNSVNCNVWVAAAVLGSAAIGGIATAYAANSAASAQGNAASQANATQLATALMANNLLSSQYNQTRGDLSPYRDLGANATGSLSNSLPALSTPLTAPNAPNINSGAIPQAPNLPIAPGTPNPVNAPNIGAAPNAPILPTMSQEQLDLQKPLNIDQATLQTLPGYQFALRQGLKSVQNSAAARGLGSSGAALKAAANFTQGLADTNYANYFDQEMNNRNAAYGRYNTTFGNQLGLAQTNYGNEVQNWQNNVTGANTNFQNAVTANNTNFNNANTAWSNNLTGALSNFSNQNTAFSNLLQSIQTNFGNQNTQFGNTQTANQSAFDRLMSAIQTGENAGAQTGVLGNKAATSESSNTTGYGSAFGSNTIGAGNAAAAAANATGGAVSGAANNVANYATYRGITGQGLFGNSAPAGTPNMSYVQGIAGNRYVPTFG